MTGLKDAYSRQGGCIASSSLEYLEIHPIFPQKSQGGRHHEAQPPKKDGPRAVDVPARPPSSLGAHSWASASKELSKDDPPSPWYKLTNGALSPPRHVSAFHQPDSSYLKKATIPSVPVVIVKPQPKNSPPSTEWHSKLESCSNGQSSGGSSAGGSSGVSSGGSNGSNEEPSSPQHRAKFPSMGIGQILKKKVQPFAFPAPLFRPEPAVEVESPTPYHMQTLLCASGALKTLCWWRRHIWTILWRWFFFFFFKRLNAVFAVSPLDLKNCHIPK